MKSQEENQARFLFVDCTNSFAIPKKMRIKHGTLVRKDSGREEHTYNQMAQPRG